MSPYGPFIFALGLGPSCPPLGRFGSPLGPPAAAVAARQCCRTKQRTKRGTNGHADTKLEDIEKTQFPLLARQLQIKIP